MRLDLVMLAVQLVTLGLAVWVLVMLRGIKQRLDSIAAYRPSEPTEKLVQYWRRQMQKYEPGTPKWKAYRSRLIRVGAVDGD